MIDLGPATERMTKVLASVSDMQFDFPTPCTDAHLGDLVDHVGTFTLAFSAIARKDRDIGEVPPPPNAANLERGWRERISRDLTALAEAWREPSAWEGMTTAGGIELPCEVAGLVVLDELVVHGWDIAVASDQPYDATRTDIDGATSFITSFNPPRDGRLFGPVVSVPDGAPPLDKLLALAGRDPSWRP